MDELIVSIVLCIIVFVAVTLGAHFIFDVAWITSMLIAVGVEALLFLGIYISDLFD